MLTFDRKLLFVVPSAKATNEEKYSREILLNDLQNVCTVSRSGPNVISNNFAVDHSQLTASRCLRYCFIQTAPRPLCKFQLGVQPPKKTASKRETLAGFPGLHPFLSSLQPAGWSKYSRKVESRDAEETYTREKTRRKKPKKKGNPFPRKYWIKKTSSIAYSSETLVFLSVSCLTGAGKLIATLNIAYSSGILILLQEFCLILIKFRKHVSNTKH